MTHIIGRGRYARTTYPSAGGAGGALAAIVPLSRQRFIDGDTSQGGLTGSAAAPFKTIAQFIASRTNVSADDASANYVGWLTPSLAGYVEDISLPPYVSTELRADSISLSGGTVVTGNVVWDNTVPGLFSGAAIAALHNIQVSGSFTVLDDANAPTSAVVLSGDEVSRGSGSIGSFVSNTTVMLNSVAMYNITVGAGIDAGTAVDSAGLAVFDCFITGNVLAEQIQCQGSTFDSAVFMTNVADGGTATFFDCTFSAASNPMLTTSRGIFDGSSWMSFLEAGGTRAVGVPVLVVGGYNGAPVEGEIVIPGDVSVSLSGVNATAGFTGGGNHYTTQPAAANLTVTLLPDDALPGDTILITKADAGAGTVAVANGGATPGPICTIPTNELGAVLARWDGTDWIFIQGGAGLT